MLYRYDVESFQKIEHVINKKLDLYKIDEEQVLLLYERVCEAIRFANQVNIVSITILKYILIGIKRN